MGDFGKHKRIALECKDYSTVLRQEDVTQIYANYLPLLQEHEIDQIVLVTRGDISPSAKTYAESAMGFVHLTYLDLLNSLLDMSGYLASLVAEYATDEVSQYYI